MQNKTVMPEDINCIWREVYRRGIPIGPRIFLHWTRAIFDIGRHISVSLT